jgi:hypothetical protein
MNWTGRSQKCKRPTKHREMLSTLSHKGNANENWPGVHLTPVGMASIEKTNSSAGKDAGRKELSLWNSVWRFPKKLKPDLPHNPARNGEILKVGTR